MLMFILASVMTAAQDKGLLGIAGTVCMTGLGLIKWLDSRVRAVEKDTAANTARNIAIDDNVKWMRKRMENGRARD